VLGFDNNFQLRFGFPMMLGLKAVQTRDAISVVAEFMVDVASVEGHPNGVT
jgi:hypothetical protein